MNNRSDIYAEASRTSYHHLGVTVHGDGIDVAVVAGLASKVEFCAIDIEGETIRERRFRLRGPQEGIWHGFIPGIRPGQRYGFRAHGRWDPHSGLRYNPNKLLVDPYAKGIVGEMTLAPEVFSHRVDENLEPLSPRERCDLDSAAHVPHAVVTAAGGPTTVHPNTPWDRTVIYETHVRGLTMRMPGVPEELRGTYAGLAHPATINYLTSLGITAIELLPIHAKLSEPFLTEKGLTNYWGYNTLGFFAPEPSYATKAAQEAGPSAVLAEVKGMVQLLHEAGIEVILDVVYNHTCEGGIDGPTLSWRGLDATTYYLHTPSHPVHFMDVTGCGNSLDFRRRRVIQMTLDSLRYWAEDIGIDGFRFDLAVTLGRQGAEFNPSHPFYVALTTDPVLSARKMINEPWDLGPGGWRTGQFLTPTADWNDRFRGAVRQFWLIDQARMRAGERPGDLREIATRLSGSADLFSQGRLPGGRGTHSSINLVTAHDGFTLADLVTYNHKHNEANLEDSRDGTNDNRSWNHGTEGPDAALNEARGRSIRNMMATLVFAAGTPMITGGDEIGRSQGGNNNAYCQDNDISWIDFNVEPWQEDLRATLAYLLHLRSQHSVLRPTTFFTGTPREDDNLPDLMWCDPSGENMPAWKWFDPGHRVIQMLRSGRGFDTDALLIINGSLNDVEVNLPAGRHLPWDLAWDSSHPRPGMGLHTANPGEQLTVPAQSMRLYFATPQR